MVRGVPIFFLMQRSAVASWGAAVLTFFHCQFNENQAQYPRESGGAVYAAGVAMLTLSFCSFSGNSAEQGGAVHVTRATAVTLSSCRFNYNFLIIKSIVYTTGEESYHDNQGGALYIEQTALLRISLCSFVENSGVSGGALSLWWLAKLQIMGTFFVRNNALDRGGGFVFGLVRCISGLCSASDFHAQVLYSLMLEGLRLIVLWRFHLVHSHRCSCTCAYA